MQKNHDLREMYPFVHWAKSMHQKIIFARNFEQPQAKMRPLSLKLISSVCDAYRSICQILEQFSNNMFLWLMESFLFWPRVTLKGPKRSFVVLGGKSCSKNYPNGTKMRNGTTNVQGNKKVCKREQKFEREPKMFKANKYCPYKSK